MTSKKRGSIFLVTLTLLTVIFILGFAFAMFTGNEDFSSAMSYESEVAFNLAESAIEEFVARLKFQLNDNNSANTVYTALHAQDTDVNKEYILDDAQMVNLTAYTREIAKEVYGIQFGGLGGLSDSKDFNVEASFKLQHINAVEATSGESVLYKIHQDDKEKQGELKVTASVNYRGHSSKISLTFLIRCVKTFVPPFNYFTLFVRSSSINSESNFNRYPSSVGQQRPLLRLDNGWNSLIPALEHKNEIVKFNPSTQTSVKYWEDKLTDLGTEATTPPGRIYLGQDPYEFKQVGVSPTIIRPANGVKLMPVLGEGNDRDEDPNSNIAWQVNAMDGVFLKLDAPWTGLKDYKKNWIVYQGQAESEKDVKNNKTKVGTILDFFGLFDKTNNTDFFLRTYNVGAGCELQSDDTWPTYKNTFDSFFKFMNNLANSEGGEVYQQFANPTLSGFHPFGYVAPQGGINEQGRGSVDYTKVSPTLIYGYALNQYYRASQIKLKNGQAFELPYVDEKIFEMTRTQLKMENQKVPSDKDQLNASQAKVLFANAGVTGYNYDKLIKNWDDLDPIFKRYEYYSKFMSSSGSENYNNGLIHFIERVRYTPNSDKNEYEGDLTKFLNGPLENYPYPYDSIPKDMDNIIRKCPVGEYYYGPLMYAMPDAMSTYLYDFYFLPRSTEDFFRGRMTLPDSSGTRYDRFVFKYIDNPLDYRNGIPGQTLSLNGILTLNESEELMLNRLQYKGHGIIYSSPMMGGGKVVINGDLLGVDSYAISDGNNDMDAYLSSAIGENMLTIIAPHIVIATNDAAGSRCYVEANLISVSEPLQVVGEKPITIKGSVVTPSLNLERDFRNSKAGEPYAVADENVIIYNALNGIWRKQDDPKLAQLMENLYVTKIVTGGVGKFDWKSER